MYGSGCPAIRSHEEDAARDSAPHVLAPGIAVDMPVPTGWQPLASFPLLLIVGLSGVGKSSAMRALTESGAAPWLLPDRRLLTEQLIIAPVRQREGMADRPLSRLDRYPYVRQFLRQWPGGMAEILGRLAIDPAGGRRFLVFDSLRGAHEIAAASRLFPRARYALLEAPAAVRVQRLLARNDPHDQLARAPARAAGANPTTLAALGVPAAGALFDAEQEHELCASVAGDPRGAAALRRALEIMVEEQRLYPDAAMHAALDALPPRRVARIDTSLCGPTEAARACLALFAAEPFS
jgi:hypothetical protein